MLFSFWSINGEVNYQPQIETLKFLWLTCNSEINLHMLVHFHKKLLMHQIKCTAAGAVKVNDDHDWMSNLIWKIALVIKVLSFVTHVKPHCKVWSFHFNLQSLENCDRFFMHGSKYWTCRKNSQLLFCYCDLKPQLKHISCSWNNGNCKRFRSDYLIYRWISLKLGCSSSGESWVNWIDIRGVYVLLWALRVHNKYKVNNPRVLCQFPLCE